MKQLTRGKLIKILMAMSLRDKLDFFWSCIQHIEPNFDEAKQHLVDEIMGFENETLTILRAGRLTALAVG